MRTNFLTRYLDHVGSRREAISPYLFGLRGVNNRYFIPSSRDLPEKGLDLKCYVFDFGFNNAGSVLLGLAENDTSLAVRRNFILWGICGVARVVPTSSGQAAATVPSYLVQVSQTHDGKIFQLFNKNIADLEGAGSGAKPYLLKQPHLVLANDTLDVDVQNVNNSSLQVQIALWGGEFD